MIYSPANIKHSSSAVIDNGNVMLFTLIAKI